MGPLLLPAILWLAACSTGDVGIVKHDVDDDGDGFTVDVDCDDEHATVNPDAAEACNGVDDDCDGVVDDDAEGRITVYTDADADGYGDAGTAAFACELGAGQSLEPGDCDDQNDDVSPAAVEVCNEVDDDCDSRVDEDAIDVVAVYDDGDGDGYGDGATERLACAAGVGESTRGDDCDDAQAAVHPGAAEEDCADPTDYNCDGSVAWADADGDGWAACEECDDGSAGVNPDAAEVCDELDTDEDCSGAGDDADPGVEPASFATFTRDVDGDGYGADGGLTVTQCDAPSGYAAVAGDCDDYAATINPAAAEVCDAADVDEDCDGSADDGDTSTDPATWSAWYADADSDGYGDAGAGLLQCDAPPGHVADLTDCDDARDDVNPAAAEGCDGGATDEDCDGLVDDADSGPTGTTAWYADTDSDTYGDAGTVTWACAAPAGTVADDTDCDDVRADVNPGAAEVCDGTTDEDCDTLVDDDDSSVTGTSAWYADGDADGFGGATSVAACVAPAGHLATSTDCDDAAAAVNPAAAEACNGVDDDCDTLVDDDDSALADPETWYLDADGDGFGSSTTTTACVQPAGYATADDDCDDADATAYPGAAEVCEDGTDQDCDGGDDACPGVRISGTHDASGTGVDVRFRGASQGDSVGNFLVAGDFSGDGVGDLFAGTGIFVSPSGGLVVGWYGSFTGGLQNAQDYDDAVIDTITTRWNGSNFPDALTNLGDQDGDGIDDIGVHSQENDYPDYPQALLVYYGGFTGTVTTAMYDEFYVCSSSADGGNWDQAGGQHAVVCGDEYRTSAHDGIVEVYAGGSVVTTFTAATSGQWLGKSVAGGDDVDGDGIDDVWFGTDWSSLYHGGAYLFYGPQTGTISVTAADVTITGASAADYFGTPVKMPGDIDGDGVGDLAAASGYTDHNGRAQSGSIYIFTGPTAGASDSVYHARLDGAAAGAYLQEYDFGDFDGDDEWDLVVGTRWDHTGGSMAGAAWLQYGPLAGAYDLGSADASWIGDDDTDWLGEDVAAIPDTNGDGFDELAFGASSVDNGSKNSVGVVYVWYGE